MSRKLVLCLLALTFTAFGIAPESSRAQTAATPIGIFEGHNDVGAVLHPGSLNYDSAKQTYTVTGSGENMWAMSDAFQFAWKKVSGDATLTADISFANMGGNEHKKAALIFRQSLDADSVYIDVALHASGLTSLQFRDEKGGATHEIQSSQSAPKRLRIARRGDYVYMALSSDGTAEPTVAGGWLRMPLAGTFYVGIGVCSHDKDVMEKATFTNVTLVASAAVPSVDVGPAESTAAVPPLAPPSLYSTLETVEIDSGDRRVRYIAPGRFEAPNWTPTAALSSLIATATLSACR